MGFLDSLRGIGRALGGVLETGIETFGPALVQAGSQFLVNKAFPGASASLPPSRSFFFPPTVSRTFQQFDRPGPLRLPPGGFAPAPRPSFLPFLPGGATPTGFTGQRAQLLNVAAQRRQPVPAFSDFRTAGFDIPGFDIVSPFQAQGTACPQFFAPGGMTARPVSLIMVPNPATGKPTFYRHAGRPILFSGDLQVAKRVDRLARRARRSRPRR